MSKEITLPSGMKVTLRDPKKIKYGDRKKLYMSIDIEGSDLVRALAMNDALIAILVDSWSLDIPVPAVSADSINELEVSDYDALVEHTKDAQNALFPNLTSTPENEQDPKAPTENSNA